MTWPDAFVRVALVILLCWVAYLFYRVLMAGLS